MAIVVIVISIILAPVGAAMMSALGGTAVTGAVATGAAAAGLSTGVMAGISTAITWGSNAMSIYNAAMNAKTMVQANEIAKERAERDYKHRKQLELSDANEAGFIGTLGSVKQNESSDFLMYDGMFNQLDMLQTAVEPHESDPGYLF